VGGANEAPAGRTDGRTALTRFDEAMRERIWRDGLLVATGALALPALLAVLWAAVTLLNSTGLVLCLVCLTHAVAACRHLP